MLVSSIVSLGQTGKDTVACYNAEELRKIAKGLIEKNQCLENYDLSLKEIDILNQIVDLQLKTIDTKDLIIYEKDVQISNRDSLLIRERKNLELEKKKHRNTKIKFSILTGLITGLSIWYVTTQ